MGSTKGWPVPSWRNRTAMRVPSVAPSASGVFRIEPDFLMRSFTHRRPLALIAHEVAAPFLEHSLQLRRTALSPVGSRSIFRSLPYGADIRTRLAGTWLRGTFMWARFMQRVTWLVR